MNILITGYKSLLATNIAKHLLGLGHNVTLIGRSRKNNEKFFNFIKVDWDHIEKIFQDKMDIDILIHCAGINSQKCLANPNEAIRFNSYLSARLSELCAIHKVKNFIYLSSVHVYGSNHKGLISEETLPADNHPYGLSKFLGEKLIESNLFKSNTKYLILRLSNIIATPIFEETDCWHLLPQSICESIFKNKTIILNSNPNYRRDFVGISQLNHFIQYFLVNNKSFKSGIYNFASNKMTSIYDLALRFANLNYKLYGYNVEIKFNKENLKKVTNSFNYSNAKIKAQGFYINRNLDQEIECLLRYKNNLIQNN